MDWVSVSSSVMLLQSKNSERLFLSTALKRTTMADTGSFTCDFARRRRPFARSAAKSVKIFESLVGSEVLLSFASLTSFSFDRSLKKIVSKFLN